MNIAVPAVSIEDSYVVPGASLLDAPTSSDLLRSGNNTIQLEVVTYDNGIAFSYTYDAAGNTSQAVKTVAGQTRPQPTFTTRIISFRRLAHEDDESIWQYTFDGNGSQTGNSAKGYT